MKNEGPARGASSVGAFILLAGSIVILTFLFLSPLLVHSDCACVRTVTISAMSLHAGKTATNQSAATSEFTITLNNPGAQTSITSITLTGANLTLPIIDWSSSPTADILIIYVPQTRTTVSEYQTIVWTAQSQPTVTIRNGPGLMPPGTTSFSFFPVTNNGSESIVSNLTYNYVINFQNGQSVSGSLTAQ